MAEMNTLGVIAIVIALIGAALGGVAMMTGNEKGDMGPAGGIGPTGPTGSAGGEQGPSGEDGEDGIDAPVTSPPVITFHTMEGLIGFCEDWTLSVDVEDSDGTMMKVEFYLLIETEWLEEGWDMFGIGQSWPQECDSYMAYGGCPGCCYTMWHYYTLTDMIGDHYWLPIYNEVGYNGTYSFNLSYIRDLLVWHQLIDVCDEFTWRVDVQDCGCFISESYMFSPTCTVYGECSDCCWICEYLDEMEHYGWSDAMPPYVEECEYPCLFD